MLTFKPWAMLLGVGTTLLISACQNQGNTATPVQNENVKTYSTDGYLGLTDANPNLPTGPSYHTYSDDVRTMRSVIKQIPGVQSSNVTINGPIANVRLQVATNTSDAELDAIRQNAQSQLAAAMPRYSVQVTVSRR
ncbi:hypothetical protein [Paenibacillus hamazuiensis]|uniref:hypothetical protein n=1 Tax=Paenibacillus hamazuiensis TaxID=2936508 RepID=UPI00200CC746|nr:hypothetical protein [Paenibacillus hamazuiensis]